MAAEVGSSLERRRANPVNAVAFRLDFTFRRYYTLIVIIILSRMTIRFKL